MFVLGVSVSSVKPKISDVLLTPGKAPLVVALVLLLALFVSKIGRFGRFAVE